MAIFLFKCPITGYTVQGHVAVEDEAAEEGTAGKLPGVLASAFGRSENH
jgi:hypothetical protein